MLTSTGHADTDQPERWAKQLASHLGHKVAVSQTPDGPLLTFAGAGTALLTQDATGFLARVEANDDAGLARIQDVVGRHLERFGQRHELTITWQTPG